MRFSIEIVEMSYWKLKFNDDCPQINYKLDLPLLVDENGLVLVGSSFRKHFSALDKVSCIIAKPDAFLTNALWEIEKGIAEENDTDRFYRMEEELKNYINKFSNPFE